MKKSNKKDESETFEEIQDEIAAEGIDPIPLPFPLRLSHSGLYRWNLLIPPLPVPHPIPIPIPIPNQPVPNPTGLEGEVETEASAAIPILFRSEELRVDVDGPYPQMQISGASFSGLTNTVSWIASVAKTGTNQWSGGIWYKDGNVSAMPYTRIVAVVTPSIFPAQRIAKVTFSGGGATSFTRTYAFVSPYFHTAEFEYDFATGVTPVTQINTCDHPNRPASLPCETLSITKVYQRAGFDVKISAGNNQVPITLAAGGANPNWSDNEMHDAMQVYWSHFANKAQWSMWVFFAALHEMGTNLGGIMFDDIGPNHRQGTSLFNNSFISQAPAGDPNPAAWVRRMKFWTACHEMGHAFNLAHSWQESLGTPWIPLTNEPEGRTFMNYPYNVVGGTTAFFNSFFYRFSDQELKFLRHAPFRFVEMGNADWFDHHGFQQAETLPEPTFRLEVRANRAKPIFEFLEPVVVELKLTNTSSQPRLVDEKLLASTGNLTVIVKRKGDEARQWLPYAQYCFKPNKVVLNPGDSVYDSLFVAAGKNGWAAAEPGNYLIQAALHLENEDIVSAPFYVRIAPPRGYDEEYLAQDFFSDDVGRILAFDGSKALTGGIETLQEVSDRLKDRNVAIHAKVALGSPLTRDYKLLILPDGVREMAAASDENAKISIVKAKPTEAKKDLSDALLENTNKAAETLGHIDYKNYVDQFSAFESEQGNDAVAAKSQSELYDTLSNRGVLKRVLDEIDDRRSTYAPAKAKTAKR